MGFEEGDGGELLVDDLGVAEFVFEGVRGGARLALVREDDVELFGDAGDELFVGWV